MDKSLTCGTTNREKYKEDYNQGSEVFLIMSLGRAVRVTERISFFFFVFFFFSGSLAFFLYLFQLLLGLEENKTVVLRLIFIIQRANRPLFVTS